MSGESNADRVALEGLAWCAERGATVRFARPGGGSGCGIEVPSAFFGRRPVREQGETFRKAYLAARSRWEGARAVDS